MFIHTFCLYMGGMERVKDMNPIRREILISPAHLQEMEV